MLSQKKPEKMVWKVEDFSVSHPDIFWAYLVSVVSVWKV